MIDKIKQWLKYRRVHNMVERAARNAVGMNYWGRAHNLYDRLDRVMGSPPQFRLVNYQFSKRNFVDYCGGNGNDWAFHPYTLS